MADCPFAVAVQGLSGLVLGALAAGTGLPHGFICCFRLILLCCLPSKCCIHPKILKLLSAQMHAGCSSRHVTNRRTHRRGRNVGTARSRRAFAVRFRVWMKKVSTKFQGSLGEVLRRGFGLPRRNLTGIILHGSAVVSTRFSGGLTGVLQC